MKAVWSYETYNGRLPFCKAELYAIQASVLFWKKLNPSHNTFFVCDKITKEFFESIGILKIWDEVCELKEDNEINKKVFWASSKIRAINQLESPLVHIDLDFFTWIRFSDYNFFDKFAGASFEEETLNYYEPVSNLMKNIYIDTNIKFGSKAYNTFILYIGTDILKNEFCKISLEYMQKASNTNTDAIYNKDKSLYMIFAEQQIFANVAKSRNFPVRTLIKEKIIPNTDRIILRKNNLGIFNDSEVGNHLVHLGHMKKDLRNNMELQNVVINHIKVVAKELNVNLIEF